MSSAKSEPAETRLAEIVQTMKSVAVVGVKSEKAAGEPAYDIPLMLQQRGVKIFPVNPTIKSTLGQPALKDVASVPERVDVLNVFRRVDAIPELADAVLALPAAKRPAVVWFQTGIRHDDAAARLRAAGFEVVQDRCIGVYAVRYRKSSR